MERQKPTTTLKHNDEFSKALMESYTRWMGGEGFQGSQIQEVVAPPKKELATPERAGGADASTSIPDLQKKGGEDNFATKDPKENAGAPDPATDLRVGAGVKQSHGAEIRDTTKVVAKESCDTCSYCGGKGCSRCEKEDKKDMKKEEVVHEELIGTTYEFELDGVTYMMEKKKGLDGKACWKGYKQMGTKMKGGKRVDNCVKAGYEPTGEEITEKKLDPVNHKELKGDHADRKDKDIDNDGDVDKSDKYLHARRKKVSKIIGTKKKMKEEAEKK
ncbi:hypothetical protein [Synechococcus phage S-H9-2]|jgi:hypothetical protein|uniref:Uncharacterized protein n=1 Tax=Synechococcus phage S-H9-2 TaxID=2783669 RepID=A0A873WL28_9CAUD|nr:hypothetical protein PQC10_gp084 [Synechococcus phage S-H9-2]QPB08361.1 hypothetical protein [Synechococcus phage S-H9-2]